jgi:hypothetical protein
LLEFGSSQCEIIDDFHLPNASLFWPKITPREQFRADSCASEPVQKTTWKKGTPKKENGQRNKLHVHLVKPETTICTQHTLGNKALLVLLVSFIYGCLVRESHERLYVYLGPRLQEAVEFDSDRRWSLTQRKYCSVLTQETLLNHVAADCLIHIKWDGRSLWSWTRMDGRDQKIEERIFVSLKWTLPGVPEPEYLGLAQPCFN